MSKYFKVSVGAVAAVALLVCTIKVARSEEQKSEQDKAAMMQAMMEAGKPGPEHERLKAYAGDWDADCTFNCPLDNSTQKSKGVMRCKMMLGDRYLQLNYEGEMAGPDGKTMMPFKGMGIGGYDKGKKKYTNLWIDEMSTSMMLTEGTADGNTITFDGGFTDPMTGKPMKVKEIVTETDATHHKYELHMEGPDGKMMKVMEISYTKRA